MSQDHDMLSSRQVAAALRVSLPTVHRMARTGALPVALQLDGLRGARLFRRADVESVAAERTAR